MTETDEELEEIRTEVRSLQTLMLGAEYNSALGGMIQNHSGVPDDEVIKALADQHKGLMQTLNNWVSSTKPSFAAKLAGSNARQGGLFYRDRYLTPTNPYDQMRTSYNAVEQDDIVSQAVDNTEALAFASMSLSYDDEDMEDALNQWAAWVDLDSLFRQMWRELFTVSQVYVGMLWGSRTFKARGKTENGNTKRKEVTLLCPKSFTLLDPLKIVPVGNTLFGREGLAYIATRSENNRFNDIIGDDRSASDEIVEELIAGKYTPSEGERKDLQNLGIDTNMLWLLDPTRVFRHTATRSSFQRFAPIRMRSIFEILDLKQQLRQMERAHLLGATNFILVVKKGTDQMPADQAELAHLRAEMRTNPRVPVIVGDHRLSVEIVTPNMDNTLRAEKYNTIDSRLTARLYGLMQLGNYHAGASKDDSGGLTKVIGRNLESRRHMMRRSFERHVLRPMMDVNDELKDMPELRFHPKSIALGFDANLADFIMRLGEMGDLSRETRLSQFDFDQAYEARQKEREAKFYDDIFKTQVPFSAPQNPDSGNEPAIPPGRDNGGGRRNGGGRAPGRGQGQPPRRPSRRSDRGRDMPEVPNAGLILTVQTADGEAVDAETLRAMLAAIEAPIPEPDEESR